MITITRSHRGFFRPRIALLVGASYNWGMSTTPPENWRDQALRQMELADEPVLKPAETQNELGIFFAKLAFLVVLSVGLVYFLGFGLIFAVLLVGWYLFWPR